MIKAIIFDYGGVLSVEGDLVKLARELALKYGKDPQTFPTLLKESWKKARINEIPSSEFFRCCSSELGITPIQMLDSCMRNSVINGKMIELVVSLHNYKLALLSNHVEGWLEIALDADHIRELFDIIVTSYNTGFAKPDARIYHIAMERLKVAPSECVFIDDLRRNVRAAQDLGMKTIHFQNTEQCKEELEKMGIIFAQSSRS